jgi:hypothetical protein
MEQWAPFKIPEPGQPDRIHPRSGLVGQAPGTGGVAVPTRKYCEATTAGTDGVVVQVIALLTQ